MKRGDRRKRVCLRDGAGDLQHRELEDGWGELTESLDGGCRLAERASERRHVEEEKAEETDDEDGLAENATAEPQEAHRIYCWTNPINRVRRRSFPSSLNYQSPARTMTAAESTFNGPNGLSFCNQAARMATDPMPARKLPGLDSNQQPFG